MRLELFLRESFHAGARPRARAARATRGAPPGHLPHPAWRWGRFSYAEGRRWGGLGRAGPSLPPCPRCGAGPPSAPRTGASRAPERCLSRSTSAPTRPSPAARAAGSHPAAPATETHGRERGESGHIPAFTLCPPPPKAQLRPRLPPAPSLHPKWEPGPRPHPLAVGFSCRRRSDNRDTGRTRQGFPRCLI